MKFNLIITLCFFLILSSVLFIVVNHLRFNDSTGDLLNRYEVLQGKVNDCNDVNLERINLINANLNRASNILSSEGKMCRLDDIVNDDWIYLYYDLYYCGACKDSLSAIINSYDRKDIKLVILTSIDNERVFFAKANDITSESDILFYNLIDENSKELLDIGVPIIFQINSHFKIVNPFVFQKTYLTNLRLYLEAFFVHKNINCKCCVVL